MQTVVYFWWLFEVQLSYRNNKNNNKQRPWAASARNACINRDNGVTDVRDDEKLNCYCAHNVVFYLMMGTFIKTFDKTKFETREIGEKIYGNRWKTKK